MRFLPATRLMIKVVLFVAAVVLAVLAYPRLSRSAHILAHRRFPERSIELLGRAGVTVLAVALLAGVSLAALDLPVAAGEAGKPVVRTSTLSRRPAGQGCPGTRLTCRIRRLAGRCCCGPQVRIRLYASARVAFLPAELGHAHGEQDGWMPGGTLTPVMAPPEP